MHCHNTHVCLISFPQQLISHTNEIESRINEGIQCLVHLMLVNWNSSTYVRKLAM